MLEALLRPREGRGVTNAVDQVGHTDARKPCSFYIMCAKTPRPGTHISWQTVEIFPTHESLLGRRQRDGQL